MTEETILVKTVSLIKKFIMIIISLFVIYHSILHIDSRGDSCRWLLQHGKLVANNKWQPFGCLLYSYNKTDSKLCLRRSTSSSKSFTHLLLMGDSRTLQLYHYIKEYMFSKSNYSPVYHNYSINYRPIYHDTLYEDEDLGLFLEFRWRPNPTLDMYADLNEILSPLGNQKRGNLSISEKLKFEGQNSTVFNRILIIGQSLWPSERHESFPNLLESYKTNMTRLVTYLKNLKQFDNSTKILWSIQDPIDERKAKSIVNISNSQIDEFNYVTENLIKSIDCKDIVLLASHRAITKSLSDFINEDGIHSSELIVGYKAQVVLNYMCNRIYGYDSTCCSKIQDVTFTQLLIISAASVLISAYMIYLIRPYFSSKEGRIGTVRWQKVPLYENSTRIDQAEDQDQPNCVSIHRDDFVTFFTSEISKSREKLGMVQEELFVNLAKFSMAILFMFICDRTNFFMKENKYFTMANFILPLIYMFALGIFFTEAQPDSSYSRAGSMLGRNQTDEWKGWMQLVILIYNLSSAENNLRIYMVIRVLLSSYLFLTGYGHFTYFYKTGDMSMRRLCQTILRLNLLVVCLCLCMNRPYQYYYFIPLVTFWFVVIFIFMRIKPIINPDRPTANDHFWIIFKLSVLLGLTTLLYLSEVFFEKIFLLKPWSFLFTTGGNYTTIKEWWHHWSVDRYSAIAGIIYGFVHWTLIAPYLGINNSNIIHQGTACHSRESSQGSQDGLVLSNPLIAFQNSIKPKKSFFLLVALIGLSLYSLFGATCSNKSSCDEIHAYISFVPIISYIILRNANEFLRNRHSTLFSFIGRISLSLSLCQYHIWLAAGQRGLLVLVPSNPTLNLVITSIIFITTAYKLNSINKRLSLYATNSD